MTPGEWSVMVKYNPIEVKVLPATGRTRPICEVTSHNAIDDGTAIAALPDLVAALQELSGCGYKDSHGGWIKCAPNDADLDSAHAALRKAGVAE